MASTSRHTTTHNDDSFVLPPRKLREDVSAKVYTMNRSGPNLAIIFDMMFNYNPRATADMQLLKNLLCDSWNFNVVQVKVNYDDLKGDSTGILKHWLARVFTERGIMRQDDDYVFVGFFYESNLQLSSESLWDGMVTDDSFMFTRPKILFFQEYEHTVPQTDCISGRICCDSTDGAIANDADRNDDHQPSHLDIFSIHGFGYDYVKMFTEVARQDPEMELCDLLTIVHKKLLSIRTKNCVDIHPYYISTLRRHLNMTKISASHDQVDNASNMTSVQKLIKNEVPEAKNRAKWENEYKSLQAQLNELKESVPHSMQMLHKENLYKVENDVEVAQQHVFLRRMHQRHENLINWFQPEYQRIATELRDLQQKLRT